MHWLQKKSTACCSKTFAKTSPAKGLPMGLQPLWDVPLISPGWLLIGRLCCKSSPRSCPFGHICDVLQGCFAKLPATNHKDPLHAPTGRCLRGPWGLRGLWIVRKWHHAKRFALSFSAQIHDLDAMAAMVSLEQGINSTAIRQLVQNEESVEEFLSTRLKDLVKVIENPILRHFILSSLGRKILQEVNLNLVRSSCVGAFANCICC